MCIKSCFHSTAFFLKKYLFLPSGPKGDKGNHGDKGERGDHGIKGERGDHGDKGERGDHGNKGEKGFPGQSLQVTIEVIIVKVKIL